MPKSSQLSRWLWLRSMKSMSASASMRVENDFVASTSIECDQLKASMGTTPMPSSQLSPSERWASWMR